MAEKTIYIATENENKLKEIKRYAETFSGLHVKFLTLNDLGTTITSQYNPVEDGDSFLKNAAIKAKALYQLVKAPVMAEDSGLEVDALHGRPGIHSSRYGKDDAERISRLLGELESFSSQQRQARFVTSLCFLDEHGNDMYFNGVAGGEITLEACGENGFGYDPVFYSPDAQKTFAEITREEKHAISHRGKALKQFFTYLSGMSK
ncbi:MAG: RdgB/HAM1 family non-canonical purine NTP pyrophosphatase [Leptospirales bacterium]